MSISEKHNTVKKFKLRMNAIRHCVKLKCIIYIFIILDNLIFRLDMEKSQKDKI